MAAALVAACDFPPPDKVETLYPNPSGTVSLVQTTTSGGGAAGYIIGEWTIRFGAAKGADVLVTGHMHAPPFTATWLDDERLNLCIPGTPRLPASRLEAVEADTPTGPATVRITYRCPPAAPTTEIGQ